MVDGRQFAPASRRWSSLAVRQVVTRADRAVKARRWPWPLPREAGRNRTKVIITHVIQRTRTENRFSVDAPPQFQADTVAFTLDDSCATLESQRSVAFPSVLFV